MQIVSKNISELKKHPKNFRKHPQRQIDEMAKSVKTFGVVRPIVVDETNTILCGHGLYETLLFLNYETVDCYVVKNLTENQKKKLLLADNKIYSLGYDDTDIIDEILSGMEGDFEIPGYDSEVLDALYGKTSLADEEIKEVDEIKQDYSIPKLEKVDVKVDKSEVKQQVEVIEEQKDEETERKYILCPHCNMRIYLDD